MLFRSPIRQVSLVVLRAGKERFDNCRIRVRSLIVVGISE